MTTTDNNDDDENPLLSARADKSLTQEQLAQLSGVNKDTISRIENGRKAHVITLTKLAKALEVNPSLFKRLRTTYKPGAKPDKPA